MSVFDPETANLDDPGIKLFIRGSGGGRTVGSGGSVGTFGLPGGGGGAGLPSAAGPTASDPSGMKALLRKRLLSLRGASYAAPMTPMAQPASASPGMTAATPTGAMDVGVGMGSWLNPRGGRGRVPGALAPPGPISTTGGATGQNPDWGLNPNGLPGDVNFGSGMLGTLNEILRAFMGSGAFGTNPNPAIMDAVRARALADAGGLRDRNTLLAQSLGADPATAASSALQADLQGQGGVARALSDASLEGLTSQRDFGQALLKGLLGIQGTQNQYKPGQSGLDIVERLAKLAQGMYP